MDWTEVMICQNLFCPGIREAVRKEVKSVTRASIIKRPKIYGKVPTKLVDKTLWNKICVDLILNRPLQDM